MKSKLKPGKNAARAPRHARKEDLRLDDDEEEGDEELELDDVDDVDLQRAVEELQGGGDGGTIYVRKLEPKDEAGDCDAYPVSVWPTLTEQLRADWGDGKYAITIRRSNGQIAGRGTRQLAKRVNRVPATPALDVLQVKRETREELQAQMAPMLAMMQSAFNALIGRPASAAADPIDSFVKLHKLTDRGGDGGHKSFLEGVQFVKELVGTPGNAGVADVAIKFLDKLTFEPTPAASPGAAAAPAPQSREQFMQIVQRAIAQRIPILLRGALQGTEASVYAQLVLDQLPDQYLAIVAEQLQRADWWDQLVAIAPDVGAHRAWFTALRDEVLREIEAPPAPSG